MHCAAVCSDFQNPTSQCMEGGLQLSGIPGVPQLNFPISSPILALHPPEYAEDRARAIDLSRGGACDW